LQKYLNVRLYQLHATQTLPAPQPQVWEFLSHPANLKVITPAHMGFHILSGGDRPMFPGQIIQYRVSPFPGYSTKWVTEITHLREGSYFVDEQRSGPYALWHHKHFLRPVHGGTEMEDIIDYKVPFGLFGQWAHTFLIKKQLQIIFTYREQKLKDLFGSMDAFPGKTDLTFS